MAKNPHDMVQLVNAKVKGSRGKTYECTIGQLDGCFIAKSQCEYDEFTGVLLVKRWLLNNNSRKWHLQFNKDRTRAYGSDEALPPAHYIDAIRDHMREIEHCLAQLDKAMHTSKLYKDTVDSKDESEEPGQET